MSHKEILKYRGMEGFPSLWSLPVYSNEYTMVVNRLANGYKVLDVGCGDGKIYNQVFKATGLDIEYVGLDNDPALKGNVNFPLFATVEELEDAGYGHRYFDGLLMMNFLEHMNTVDDAYDVLIKTNPFIDGDIFILTPNPRCLDYLFVDPDHDTFFAHDILFGILKHLGYEYIEIWRGGGIHRIRQERARANPDQAQQLLQINEQQKQICTALGLDWYGNLLAIGDREKREDDTSG